MKKALIFTNLPQRDKVVDEILAENLRALGFEARVSMFLPHNRMHVLGMKPNVVILPEIRCQYTVEMVETMRSWGIIVISRRCEGGCGKRAWSVMCDDEKDTAVGTWPYEVDLELVWGEEFRDIVLEKKYGTKETVKAVGAFPFDIYFYDKIAGKKKGGKKTVLFACGWPMADRGPRYCVPEAPPESSIHKIAYDKHRQGRDRWIEIIKELHALIGKEWDFLLRLKTGEIPNEYVEKLGDIVKITPPEPMILALKRTDVLVHAGSTVGAEAHYMDMPAISLLGDLVETPGYTPARISPYCKTTAELKQALESVEFGKSNANLDALEQSKTEFYGPIDGRACERSANLINEVPLKKTSIPDEWTPQRVQYPFPGATPQIEQWHCDCCNHTTYVMEPNQDMIKCVWCGISLIRYSAIPAEPVGGVK